MTIPALVLAATVGLALATLLLGTQSVARLKERVVEEERLRLQSRLDHVQDYFDAVYSTLLYISLDREIVELWTGSREYIQRFYDDQAVANAVCHAQPHDLEIRLLATSSRLVLTVADDGSGL